MDFFATIKGNKICRHFQRGRFPMPAHYCTLHARLWSEHGKEWIDFPREKMEAVKSLHKLLQRRGIDTPEYRVIETACDRCDAQKFQEQLKKRDPP
jgi:hypothetical protein